MDSVFTGIQNKMNTVIAEQSAQLIKAELAKIDSTDKIQTWEWLTKKSYSNDLLLHSLLLKFENKPYKMDILYYRKNKTWYVQQIVVEKDVLTVVQNYQKPVQPCTHGQ